MKNIFYVGIGGMMGSVFRYAITKLFLFLNWNNFPWATFSVNIIGCYFIGIIYFLFEQEKVNSNFYLLCVTGFLGGFTTFSSFGLETFIYIKNENFFFGILYSASSILTGVIFCWLGYFSIKNI